MFNIFIITNSKKNNNFIFSLSYYNECLRKTKSSFFFINTCHNFVFLRLIFETKILNKNT